MGQVSALPDPRSHVCFKFVTPLPTFDALVQDKAMTDFRQSLPEDAKMIVAKNTLLARAAGRPSLT